MNEKNAPPKDPRIIESLDEYLLWVKTNSIKGEDEQKKNANKIKEFAFRGIGRDSIDGFNNMPKCQWESKDKNFNLVRWQEDLINEFTMAGHNDKEKKHDLQLLAKIQHIEPRTAFIDYSLNPLVALYFACQNDKPYGLIITNDIGDIEKFKQIEVDNIHKKIDYFFNQDNKGYDINQANKDLPWVWILPTADDPRMIAQQALFIFGTKPPSPDNYCIIERGNKEEIKEELKKQFAIDGNMLFPDFAGRAKYITTQERTAEFYFKQANVFFQKGKYKEAIKDYDKSIELNLQHTLTLAYANRGVAKAKLGKDEEAIRDYDEAIKLDANYASAYANRGAAKGELGQDKEAITDLDDAIKLNPQYALAYIHRGATKYKSKNPKDVIDAIKDFDKAIELNPQYALAYVHRGAAKFELKKLDEAIKDFDEAIILNPQYPYAYYNRGLVKSHLHQHPEAIKDYDKAIALNPEYDMAYINRGNAKGELGQYAESIKDFDRAIKLSPKYANAYFNRGITKGQLGQYAESIKDLDKAIELNPQDVVTYINREVRKNQFSEHEKIIKDYIKPMTLTSQDVEAYVARGRAKKALAEFERMSGHKAKAQELEEGAKADFTKYEELAKELNKKIAHPVR